MRLFKFVLFFTLILNVNSLNTISLNSHTNVNNIDSYYEFKHLIMSDINEIYRYSIRDILDINLDNFYYFLLDYPCDDEIRDKFNEYLKNDSEFKKRKTIKNFYINYRNYNISHKKINIILTNYLSLMKKCYIFPSPNDKILLYNDLVTCITMYTPKHICYKIVISDEEDNIYSTSDTKPQKYDIKLTYHINKYDKACTSKTGNVYINIIEPKKERAKNIINTPFKNIVIISISIILIFVIFVLFIIIFS